MNHIFSISFYVFGDCGFVFLGTNARGDFSGKSGKGDFAKQANNIPFSARGMIYYPA